MAACLALAGLLACSGSTPAGQVKRRGAQELFGAGAAVANPGVAEPSGIVFHPRLGHLFVVGDEGTLAELDAEGRYLRAWPVRGNLEDVAVHDPTGDLVLLDEDKGRLIVYDPGVGAVKARWRLDTEALVGKREGGRDGFEGIAFKPEAGRPGGGVFYLTHQRGPAMLVAVAFDPAGAEGTVGASALVGRWRLEGHRDLTAVSWSPALHRLLVLADAEDQLLIVNAQGAVEARLSIAGVNQEGVCLDAAGTLWIADDRAARVVRYAGAQAAIAGALRGYSTEVK